MKGRAIASLDNYFRTHDNHSRSHTDNCAIRAYRHVCGQRGRNVTVALAISPINGLVFHSAIIGGMNAERFSEFLAQLSKVEPRP